MYKRFVCISAAVIILLLGCVAGLNFLHDPLFQYRNPFGKESFENSDEYYAFENATYQVPGMAKNFEYDTLITGSSMTQNFDSSYFDELMGTNALKLSLSGGNARNIASVVEVALEHNPQLSRVYASLDDFSLKSDSSNEGNQSPYYLVDNNLANDVEYIFNKDVLFNYTLDDYISAAQLNSKTTPRDQIFMWYGFPYGEEKVLSQYWRTWVRDTPAPEDYYLSNAKANLEQWWLPLIERYPDVEFNFFMPPYSMLYWDNCSRKGEVDATIAMYGVAAEYLLAYDNVHIYNFMGIAPIVENLWNYKDYEHYHWRINDFMTEAFASKRYMLTEESFASEMNALKDYVNSFDYEVYFSNPLRETTDIYTYMNMIKADKYVVITTVGSDNLANLSNQLLDELRFFGIEVGDSINTGWYVACKNEDTLWQDCVNTQKNSIFANWGEQQVKFATIEVPWNCLLSVSIDGVEYSQNSKEIMFIVFDQLSQRVIDSVAFDMNLNATRQAVWSDLPSYRRFLRQEVVVN